MICPYCLNGFVYKKFAIDETEPEEVEIKVPCDECGGMGILSCCDGLRECND